MSKGISYVIYDRGRAAGGDQWSYFIREPYIRQRVGELLRNQAQHHLLGPWGRMEGYVTLHITVQLSEVAQGSPVVYDDGTLVVVHIDTGR